MSEPFSARPSSSFMFTLKALDRAGQIVPKDAISRRSGRIGMARDRLALASIRLLCRPQARQRQFVVSSSRSRCESVGGVGAGVLLFSDSIQILPAAHLVKWDK